MITSGRFYGESGRRRVRRDRHGLGPRGPLVWASSPGFQSRPARFERYVEEAARMLAERWPDEARAVEFATAIVPERGPEPWEFGQVPLGRLYPATRTRPPHIVVYRLPLQTRAGTAEQLRRLIREVVVEQFAVHVGREPEAIDPEYGLE